MLNSTNQAFTSGKAYTSEQFQKKCTMQDSADCYPAMPSFTVTEQGVEKLLTNLNPNKASGPDGISLSVLKELAPDIAPILASLYCRPLATGEVPSDWRKATVTTVYKKGERYDLSLIHISEPTRR